MRDNSIKDIMMAELEYLNIECESRHMQTVLLCWLGKSDVPRNSKDLKSLLKLYKDETMLKIIEERDKLVE
jgi:hypothetical protein